MDDYEKMLEIVKLIKDEFDKSLDKTEYRLKEKIADFEKAARTAMKNFKLEVTGLKNTIVEAMVDIENNKNDIGMLKEELGKIIGKKISLKKTTKQMLYDIIKLIGYPTIVGIICLILGLTLGG